MSSPTNDGSSFDRADDIAGLLGARPRPLLLATDVDGTLAPIAPRPEQARLAPGAREVLRALGAVTGVTVAVVSGRSLAELRDHFGLDGVGRLVGSYGGESTQAAPLDDDEQRLLDSVTAALGQIAAAVPGARLEAKPMAVALHVRGATPDAAADAVARSRAVFDADVRVAVHEGHQVFEVAVRHITKATAVAQLRAELSPATVAFFGDDRADEGVFAALGDGDVGVKVGVGPTAARWRVAAPVDVVQVLAGLATAMR